MNSFADMVWIESRKATRSRIPLWTAMGALVMPLGIAFLIFVSRNPEISQQLGLVSAKADLLAYAGTDWPAYLTFLGEMVAAGGFLLFILVISWVFGREFVDGTLKDMLAVPVPRSSILLAKFVVVAVWSAALTAISLAAGLALGAIIGLPGGSIGALLHGSAVMAIMGCLVIVVTLPFALFASVGRGYLLPVGIAILILMMANLSALVGYGEYFPWAVPGLVAQGKGQVTSISYLIVLSTGLAGVMATYLWWKWADQNR